MTHEQKDILLKDLCARLPHRVKGEKYTIRMDGEFVPLIDVETIIAEDIITLNGCPGYMIRPYLFPLSSMTEEQKNDCPIGETNLNIIKDNLGCYGIIEMPWRLSYLFVDWCNKNHFDYRGLISIGIVNDATGLNIYEG